MISTSTLLSAFAFVLGASAAVLPKRQATVCNGQASFCDRSYGNITFFGAHDSYAFSTDPLALARDQEVNITQQLELGVRMLQAEGHLGSDGQLHFCHTSCLLFDGGLVTDYLNTVKSFLTANPTEVVTLLFTNSDGLDVPTVWEPTFTSTGTDTLAYVPSTIPLPITQWPTMGEILNDSKQLVVFLDSGANTTATPFILPEFEMIWETPFDQTDASFPCSINRTAGPLPNDEHMYLINHFLDIAVLGDQSILIPDLPAASNTNSLDQVLADANGCVPIGANRNPNFILMDWVDIGDGQAAADQLNGVSS